MLELRGIERHFGGKRVLDGIDLDVARGELVALIGPSGCGKSTLLRIVAGLDHPSNGSVRIAGRDVATRSPTDRRVGMTFDDGALYDHLTVRDNLMVGLDRFGLKGLDARAAAESAVKLVFADALVDRRPPSLSAGERRRVALARAIARRPDVLLLDEPLTHLDLASRLALREDLRRAQQASGTATLLVTHDHADALAIADRIAYLEGGRLLHVGNAESFARPAHVAVARGCSWLDLQVVAAGDSARRQSDATDGWLAVPSGAISIAADAGFVNQDPGFGIEGVVHHLAGPSGPLRRTDGSTPGVVATVAWAAERVRFPLPTGTAAGVGDSLRITFDGRRLIRFDRMGARVGG